MEKRQIRDFCIENNLLEEGDKVLLGLSGGADSVCLLFVMLSLQKEFKLELMAVHVHHGIRGEEADRDEEFCRRLCQEQKVDFVAEQVDVPALSRMTGDSLEEAGRKARYEIFNRLAEAEKCNKIAVAHHKNDQAETVLFQLVRGSRLTGLSGIRPRNGKLIRPLLGVSRKEIEAYLKEEGLEFITDSTNLENDASRNVIRNEILPGLATIQPGAVEHICETAAYIKRVDEYLEKETEHLFERAVREEAGKTIVALQPLREADSLIAEKVLYKVLCRLSGRKKDITHRHVEAALALMDLQTGAVLDLKYGITGRKAFENLVFIDKNKIDIDDSNCNNTSITENVLSTCIFHREVGEATGDFIARAGGLGDCRYRKLLDLKALKKLYPDFSEGRLELRRAAAGDSMVIFRDGRRKKVFDLLMEAKVPAEDRAGFKVLAFQDKVFLIIGLRGCEGCRVTDETECILLIEGK